LIETQVGDLNLASDFELSTQGRNRPTHILYSYIDTLTSIISKLEVDLLQLVHLPQTHHLLAQTVVRALAVGPVVDEIADEFLTVYVVLYAESVTNAVAFGLSLVDMPKSRVYLREVGIVEGTFDSFSDFVFHSAHHYFFSGLTASSSFDPPCRALSIIFISILLIAFVANRVNLLRKCTWFSALFQRTQVRLLFGADVMQMRFLA